MSGDLPILEVTSSNQTRTFHGSWYRGDNTNFIPDKSGLKQGDAIYEYFLKGLLPSVPFINKRNSITAFGSCFAAHISNHLHGSGYNINGKHLELHSHIIRFGEGIVNTFAMLQQLEWALLSKEFPADLWFSEDKEQCLVSEDIMLETRDIIQNTEVFIFTLGLSEVWFDKRSGEALWRAVPAALFDPERHYFKQTSVLENKENLAKIVELIKNHVPRAKIIFTLSPVPLMATFRPIPCLVANSVSKGTLRCAIDELLRENSLADVYYFPSYEIVTSSYENQYQDDNRHPKDDIVRLIMEKFEQYYCVQSS
jgi:hypothetical protein